MGVTKKKVYLKPEITKFEMNTENFISASGEVIITPPEPEKEWTTGILEPQCTKDGVAKKLNLYQYTCFRANSLDITSCKLFNMLGAEVGEWIKVTRISDTQFKAEIINEECSGGVEVPAEEETYSIY